MRQRIAEFKATLMADKRQATILAGLLVFLCISAGRMLLHMGPRGAKAAGLARAAKQGGDRPDAPKAGPAGTTVHLAPLPKATRDIFALDPARFPKPALPEQSAEVGPKSDTPLVEASGVAALSERERIEKQVLEEASTLRLRSTLLGVSPIAVIELVGKSKTRSVVLKVGDVHNGFQLVEVQAHSITLEKEGVRVDLTLTLPGT